MTGFFRQCRRFTPNGDNAVRVIIIRNGCRIDGVGGNDRIFLSGHAVLHPAPADKIRIGDAVAAFGGQSDLRTYGEIPAAERFSVHLYNGFRNKGIAVQPVAVFVCEDIRLLTFGDHTAVT